MKTSREVLRIAAIGGICAGATLSSGASAQSEWTATGVLNTNAATDSGEDSRPRIALDNAGHFVAVWHSTDTLGGTIGADEDILVSRSSDYGRTWSAPAALNSNAGTDSGMDRSPSVATDGSGRWVAVWHSNEDLGGTIGIDEDIMVSRSTDHGQTWSAPAPLNSNAATDSWANGHDAAVNLATDGAGNWIAVWESFSFLGIDSDILVSRSTNNGLSWSAVSPLNSDAATDSNSAYDLRPRLATDGAGNWVAVWVSSGGLGGTIGTDLDYLVSRSTNNGLTWTSPAALNSDAAADLSAESGIALVTDAAGHWVAVWHSDNPLLGGTIGVETDILVSRSTDEGQSWTAPAALNANASSDSGIDSEPSLATDGTGRWIAVWSSTDSLGGTIGVDFDVLISHSTDNGLTWTPSAPLNTNAAIDSGHDYGPRVTTDGAGHWIAVWSTSDSLSGTIGTDEDIVFSRYVLDSDQDLLEDEVESDTGIFVSVLDTGSDPNDADSDDDGVMDGIEVSLGTDPNNPLDFPVLSAGGGLLHICTILGIAIIGSFLLRYKERSRGRAGCRLQGLVLNR